MGRAAVLTLHNVAYTQINHRRDRLSRVFGGSSSLVIVVAFLAALLTGLLLFLLLPLLPILSSSFSLYRLKGKNVCINIHIFNSEERRREGDGEIKSKV